MSFEAENEVERLLMQAPAGGAQEREACLRALLDADIYVALFGEDPNQPLVAPGTTVLQKDLILNLVPAVRGDETFIPIFSSPRRIWAFTSAHHVVFPSLCRDFFAQYPDRAFFLNPGSDYGKEFQPDEVRRLLAGKFDEGRQTVRLPEGAQLYIGQPSDYPTDFVTGLAAALPELPDVRRAYISIASVAGAQPTLMLEVLSRAHDREHVARRLHPLMERLRPRDRLVDLHIALAENQLICAGVVAPFYEAAASPKPRGGFFNRLFPSRT